MRGIGRWNELPGEVFLDGFTRSGPFPNHSRLPTACTTRGLGARVSGDLPPVVVLDQRNPDIAAGIVAVQRAAYRVEADLIGFEGIPPLHEAVAEVQALPLTILGMWADGQVIALLGYSRAGPTVDIDRLAVHPSWFRRGVAQALLTALHAREASAASFLVSTGRANAPALRLYQRLGYRPIAEATPAPGLVVTRLQRAGNL